MPTTMRSPMASTRSNIASGVKGTFHRGDSMTRFLIALLLALPQLAQAQDAAAAALEGGWVVSVADQQRDRYLIVKGARTDKNLVVVESAIYGWLDGSGKPITANWRAEVFGDSIKLNFL